MNKCECKNCVHYEVCKTQLQIDEIPKSSDFKCEFYKDKSLCVEFKCKLGQIVYAIVSPEKINKVKVKQIGVVPCEEKTYVYYRVGKCAWFYEEEIGKTVFLTKEDAEARLKEIDNGK